jgi:hypothetical protein
MHAIWELLLNPDFMHAYEHGIVICCADGITRRVYPRFFTYSADYPEKYAYFISLATDKNQTKNPTEYFSQQSNILHDVLAHDVLLKRHRFQSLEAIKTTIDVRI